MELVLLPIAALLLLLTNLGTPAHATAMGSNAAEALRLLFTPGEESKDEATPETACVRTAQRRQRFQLGRALLRHVQPLAWRPARRPSLLDKRSSSFVSASVAYRTTAPPAAR